MVLGDVGAGFDQVRVRTKLVGTHFRVALDFAVLLGCERSFLGQEGQVFKIDLAVVVSDGGQLKAFGGLSVEAQFLSDLAAIGACAFTVSGSVRIHPFDGVGDHVGEDVDQILEGHIFALDLLLFEGPVQDRGQNVGVYWFLQVIPGAHLHGGYRPFYRGAAGHQDHDRTRGGVSAGGQDRSSLIAAIKKYIGDDGLEGPIPSGGCFNQA